MDMQTVLEACGVRPDTLSAAEKAQLMRRRLSAAAEYP